MGSGTTRLTRCAVAVEVAVIIYRRKPVLDVVIQQSVCGNVSINSVNNLHSDAVNKCIRVSVIPTLSFAILQIEYSHCAILYL